MARGRSRRRQRRPWRRRLLQASGGALLLSLCAVASLRFVDPPTSAFILRERIERLATGQPPPVQRWVRWQAISPHLSVAVIAAEDQRFLQHGGFDLTELSASVSARLDGRPLRGASTLTQQLARNLFLWRERSWLRKGLEAYFTLALELCLDKPRILELYLNLAELGPGTYGVGAASERHFGLPAGQLDAAQAALLAAVLPSPLRRDPSHPTPGLLRRRRAIMEQMAFLRAAGLLEELPLPETVALSAENSNTSGDG